MAMEVRLAVLAVGPGSGSGRDGGIARACGIMVLTSHKGVAGEITGAGPSPFPCLTSAAGRLAGQFGSMEDSTCLARLPAAGSQAG
jgi:hypothetical protein